MFPGTMNHAASHVSPAILCMKNGSQLASPRQLVPSHSPGMPVLSGFLNLAGDRVEVVPDFPAPRSRKSPSAGKGYTVTSKRKCMK